jgi:hypothetical protein
MRHLFTINEVASTKYWRELEKGHFENAISSEHIDDFTTGEVRSVADLFTGIRSKAKHLSLYKVQGAHQNNVPVLLGSKLLDTINNGYIDFNGSRSRTWECELPNNNWDRLDSITPSNILVVGGKRDFKAIITKSIDDYYFVIHEPANSLLSYLGPIDMSAFHKESKYYVCDGFRPLKDLIRVISK